MTENTIAIRPTSLTDLPLMTQMVFANMTGVDTAFTSMTRGRAGHLFGYLTVFFSLLTNRHGFKAQIAGRLAGFAYMHVRDQSVYVFNVNVNAWARRRGVATALIAHLEARAVQANRPWLALYVDAGNGSARALYKHLGFNEYAPTYLDAEQLAQISAPPPTTLVVQPLAPHQGRRLRRRYAAVESEAGDSWAAHVVAAEYPLALPAGGEHFRIYWQQREVGYVWRAGDRHATQLRLLLLPAEWGQTPLLLGLLTALAEPAGGAVRLSLGSSSHLAAAAPALATLGFVRREYDRLLMLKLIEG